MSQIKFYRVESLPETGEVGSLYFVYGSGGVQSMLYICIGNGLFELYTPDLYELENKIDSLEVKVEQEADSIEAKIDNIKLPEIDTTELAKEATLNEVSNKLDNLNVEVDLSSVAKQGENQEATNSAIYNDTHNVAQFFGITAATEFTPLTTEEITNEINTLWEGL